jgi:hydroxymethylglutaryl-CoA synthase
MTLLLKLSWDVATAVGIREMTVGIHAYGGYIPRMRLSRSVIAAAHQWFNPGLKALGKGERSICNWDEDAVTMAVEAARDCFAGEPPTNLDGIYLASTSLPFQDRQNAGIVAEALSLGHTLSTLDIGGSMRAATSALGTALKVARGGERLLVSAAEKRRTKAASALELTTGDGAAAFIVAEGAGQAELIGHASHAVDFVDHYRGQDEAFDYVWEERWIRDEGFLQLIPEAMTAALKMADLSADAITHFCFPSAARGVAGMLAKRIGIAEGALRDNLQGSCGEAGSAHPLIMVAHALEQSKPNEVIAVVGFGQGVDVLLFRTTSAIGARPALRGVGGYLAAGRAEDNYNRYLGINNLLTMEQGLRAEVDKQTALTTLYRNKEMLLALIGGKCTRCGTAQFPKTNVCVNPNCQASDTQEPYPFADKAAQLRSFTADRLTYSPSPPAYYGMVQFAEGGRAMIDFTDVDPGAELAVGDSMRMMFRIKDYDHKRGFRRYFWKATPNKVHT